MHGAGPHTLFGGLLLQFHEHDVRLRLDQPPNQLVIDPTGGATLWNPLRTACIPLGAGNLLNPTVTDVESQRQLLHRPFAASIRRQHLAPKIISISPSHPTMLDSYSALAKNQGLYPTVKWSRRASSP